MIEWWQLALAALIGGAAIDLTLFGWSVRALGLGWRFDGPTPGARVAFNRHVSVQYGRLPGLAWGGPLIVTDRRLVSCWGYWSRVAVLDIARTEITDVGRGWWWGYACVRVGYRRNQRLRALRIVDLRLVPRSRDELLAVFRRAGYPVVA